jgi:hypothetical protein
MVPRNKWESPGINGKRIADGANGWWIKPPETKKIEAAKSLLNGNDGRGGGRRAFGIRHR